MVGYRQYSDVSIAIPPSADAASGYAGYVDFLILFPNNAQTRLSNIQVVPTYNLGDALNIPYELNSSNRE